MTGDALSFELATGYKKIDTIAVSSLNYRKFSTMRRIFQPLLFLLARCVRHELIRQIEILKVELQMLRQGVPKKRIFLTDEEKAKLIELGQGIGPAIRHVLTIVSYESYRRWVRNAESDNPKPSKRWVGQGPRQTSVS